MKNAIYMVRFIFGATILIAAANAAENWPEFRGAGAMGVSENKNLPDEWSATKNVEWTRDLPGRGWSSPVVWGEQVFVTTVSTDGE